MSGDDDDEDEDGDDDEDDEDDDVDGGDARRQRASRPSSSSDLRRREQITAEVFRSFRPPGALNGPRERQKTTRDEKPVPGKGSGPPGTAY